MSGWWAERHVGFTVELSPQVGFMYGGPSQEFGIILSPELGMSAVSHSRATFGLELSPTIGASASSHSVASFGLTLDPYIAMREPGGFTPLFPSEELFPSTSLFPTPRSQRPGFGLSLSPSLGFSADVGYSREFSLTVTPELGMSAVERYSVRFGVEVTPEIGMSGAERYARTFDLSVSPAFGMEAVGTDGANVLYDLVGTFTQSLIGADVNLTCTAAAGDTVIVDFVVDRAASNMPTSITYDGVSMARIGFQYMANNSGFGAIARYALVGVSGGTKTITIPSTGLGGAWYAANWSSFKNVGSLGATTSAYGSGGGMSQAVTVTGGMVVQTFGLAGGGGSPGSIGTVSGATNRSSGIGIGSGLAINTLTSSGTVTTNGSATVWAGLSTNLLS